MSAALTTQPATTVLGRLLEALAQACAYNRNDQVPPAVLFWTDAERQWEPLLPRLRGLLPHLLTLGPYDPATRTGPAIWLRCMLARTLPGDFWAEDVTPIFYLPGISRQDLRAVDECPDHLQPLAGLQYRGTIWTHTNGKDWTIAAFLQSDRGGLGLDVARDSATQEMLRTALVELAEREVERLRDRQLSADDLHRLLLPDPVRQLLRWLDTPEETRTEWDKGRWKTFRSTCKKEYGFDPEADTPLDGARLLGERGKKWDEVWQRFAESPDVYAHLPARLRAARPKEDSLFGAAETWPQDNERLETELREALESLSKMKPVEARDAVAELEDRHGPRRLWVWARLGQAPLARALVHLTGLAIATEKTVAGATPDAMAENYAAGGWKADDALLAALASVRTAEDVQAVRTAVLALYRPWLEETTQRFQDLVKGSLPRPVPKSAGGKGCCILFADGLRYDVGQRLAAALAGRGLTVESGWHWSAVPPVTPTAKPAVSPVADRLSGSTDGDGFCPVVGTAAKKLTIDRFQQLLIEKGYQVLKGDDTGEDPSGLGWTEAGQLDRTGHDQGWKLARRIDEEVQALTDRIAALLAAGWKEVRVITDHGWLLLPGGLPKVDLPGHLAQNRWGRCAVLTAGSQPEVLHHEWHWSAKVWVALAHGIGCFVAGKEYAHGSLSLQECMVPEMQVRAAVVPASASLRSVRWTAMRCRVTVEGDASGLLVDLRTRPADRNSSLTEPRPVGPDGSVSLLVEDDGLEGMAVAVVLLSAGGQVLDQQGTTVGGG
jgi:hypothetical protein